MHPALSDNLYLVKEHTALFKAANNFDIFNPETGEKVIECREEKLGALTKLLRFTDYKTMTPFRVDLRTTDGDPILSVARGVSFFLSQVNVETPSGQVLGGFKQKFFSIGGAFRVLSPNGEEMCQLKGKWTSWEFKFMRDNVELARVSKKWSGIGKELFTSADNYVLEISDDVPPDNPIRELMFAAVMCIDMVLKEG